MIFDEDWAFKETILSYYDDAELTETLLFECDFLAEDGERVFKFKRGDTQSFESDLTSTVYPNFVRFTHVSDFADFQRFTSVSLVDSLNIERKWHAHSACQSKSEVVEYIFASATDENDMTTIGGMAEFLEYIFKLNIEETYKIFNEGMNKIRTECLT